MEKEQAKRIAALSKYLLERNIPSANTSGEILEIFEIQLKEVPGGFTLKYVGKIDGLHCELDFESLYSGDYIIPDNYYSADLKKYYDGLKNWIKTVHDEYTSRTPHPGAKHFECMKHIDGNSCSVNVVTSNPHFIYLLEKAKPELKFD